MDSLKWFERKFDFSYTDNIFPMILERLVGTPVRLSKKIGSISPGFLETRIDNSWSIKENIGHLTDLDNHNSKTADELIHEFTVIRSETLSKLENIPEEYIFKFSLHPRLKTPMRTMDLFLFVAEHDDHHLARISAVERQLRKTN